MLTRRVFAAAVLATPTVARAESAGSFRAFLARIRAEAHHQGISQATLAAAFQGIKAPNPKIIELDHSQPESTITWAQYRARALPAARLEKARALYTAHAPELAGITAQYPADPRVVTAIWGLESAFGSITGKYRVVESLATLAYNARRPLFHGELLNALKILDHGDIAPSAMTGSWAGAMGQPQFMPTAYLRFAVDADGDGRRNIWTSLPDVFGSIANYLVKSGWRQGEPWGQQIQVPAGFTTAGRDDARTLATWMSQGVRRLDGTAFSRPDVTGAVVMPDGQGGEAFMTYPNFKVIRRYNASDYYALAVGLLSNAAYA